MHSPRTFRFRRIPACAALATLGAGAALAGVPATAAAAPSTCFASFPSVDGGSWDLRPDGALEHSAYVGADRAFDAGHGVLRVEGQAYAAVPNDPLKCDKTANSLTYPPQKVGVFGFDRRVDRLADGRLRWTETVHNYSDKLEFLDLDFHMEIRGSQVAFTSESGNLAADDHDDWFVHADDALFPFQQWGADGAADGREAPLVLTPEDVDSWSPGPQAGDESARLSYHADISPKETVRFVHVSGHAASADAAVAGAREGALPFTGFDKDEAKSVINWAPDTDGDGVPKHLDECPAVTGDMANGCKKVIFIPPPKDPQPEPTPDTPAPQPEASPSPAPDATPQPGTTTPPQPGATPAPQPAADTTGPKVTLKKVGTKLSRRTLSGKGLKARIGCDERCSLDVRVMVKSASGKKARTKLRVQRKGLSASTRTLKLKVATKKLSGRFATVVVIATDASGNRTTVRREAKLVR